MLVFFDIMLRCMQSTKEVTMFKVLSLKLSILLKKGIVWIYPWAMKASEFVNWHMVGKVSLAFLAYPALTFLLAVSGLEVVARFMVSPFSPSDKENVWFFFLVVSVPLLLPLLTAGVYWLPKLLRSKLAIPLLKALILTLALSPFVYLFLIFAEYVLAAIFSVAWFLSNHSEPEIDDSKHYSDPWNDVSNTEHLPYSDD